MWVPRARVQTCSSRKTRASSHIGEEGQGLVEYSLILALIAIVVIAALTAMGLGVQAIFNAITTALGPV